MVRWRILARDYAARPALVDRGSSWWMNCLANQPAYISVIIVAAFPSVDGTAAPAEPKPKTHQGERTKSKSTRAAQFDKVTPYQPVVRVQRATTGIRMQFKFRPRQGSRSESMGTETLRDLCRGRKSGITQIPGGRSLALAPPATVRVASGDCGPLATARLRRLRASGAPRPGGCWRRRLRMMPQRCIYTPCDH